MPEIIVKLGDRIIHRYYFDKDVLTVGRARDNDIVIENLSVSRNHTRIRREGGLFILTDMNSANGTYVNGTRITKTEVNHNDQVSIGKHTLLFINEGSGAEAGGPREDVPPPEQMTGRVCILVVTKGKQAGQEFRVWKPETSIGRANENEIRLHDWFVSKKHAAIVRNGDGYTLRDLDSWRGTTVNGNSVREIELSDGDEIVFGSTVLVFKTMPAEEVAKLGPPAKPVAAVEMDSSVGGPEEGHSGEGTKPPPTRDSGVMKGPADASLSRQNTRDDVDVRAASTAPPEDAEAIAIDFGSDAEAEAIDDEFAPMTEDELEALEREDGDDLVFAVEDDEHMRAEWEMAEAEKMYSMGEDPEAGGLMGSDDRLRKEEEDAVGGSSSAVRKLHERIQFGGREASEEADEDLEEEEAVYGGSMSDKEPLGDSAGGGQAPASAAGALDPAKAKEIAMWEKALRNKSPLIRKNAAQQLKKLTGRDHDWQSEPK